MRVRGEEAVVKRKDDPPNFTIHLNEHPHANELEHFYLFPLLLLNGLHTLVWKEHFPFLDVQKIKREREEPFFRA